MDDNKNFELVTKHLSGNITQQEQELLSTWLNSSSDNMNLFKELKKIWELSGKYESDFEPNVHSAIERFKTRVASSQTKRFINFKLVFQVAAAVILIVVAAFSVNLLIHKNTNTSITKLNASSASNAEFVLPDSSKVWLNKNSEISYEGDFSERIVKLKGEAYFEVKNAHGKTFTIYSGASRTQVLGTSFVVKDIDGTKDVEVVVITGKVALSDAMGNDSKKVILNPGESGVYSEQKNTISIAKNEDINVLAWKTNVLSFRNTPVKDVVSALNKYFNKTISVSDINLDDCTLTSTFDHQNIEDVLEELQILWNIQYSRKGNNIQITKGGC